METHRPLFSPKTFKESCLRFYYAELEQLSFAEAAEPSRKHINAWISKKTEGQRSMVAPPRLLLLLLSSLVFLMVSAVCLGPMDYLNVNGLAEVLIRCSGFQQQRLHRVHSPRSRVTGRSRSSQAGLAG